MMRWTAALQGMFRPSFSFVTAVFYFSVNGFHKLWGHRCAPEGVTAPDGPRGDTHTAHVRAILLRVCGIAALATSVEHGVWSQADIYSIFPGPVYSCMRCEKCIGSIISLHLAFLCLIMASGRYRHKCSYAVFLLQELATNSNNLGKDRLWGMDRNHQQK